MKKSRAQLVKEFMESKAKSNVPAVDDKQSAKGVVAKGHEVKSDPALLSKFFKAIADEDKAALRGLQPEIEAEYKALTDGQNVTNNGDGGYLVPVEVSNQIIQKLADLSPIRQYATVLNVGAKNKLNLAAGKPTAYWVDEGEEITRSKVTFTQKTLDLHKIAGLGGLTYESLNDTVSSPDLQSYLVTCFADAIAEKELNAFVNGDGDGKPYGFRSSDITPVAKTGTALTYKKLVELKYALSKPYRNNSIFLMDATVISELVGMEDDNGRPIFVPAIAQGEPDTLLGRPVVECNDLPGNEVWFAYMPDYLIGEGGALRVDFGTTGDDFESDKISVRVIHRVAGRPTLGTSFAKLTLSGLSA